MRDPPVSTITVAHVEGLDRSRKKHTIHGFTEFDVTQTRQFIREYRARTGEGLSFTAFIAGCAGRTVAEDRGWHAYRAGRKLVLFDDVDIGVLVERDLEGSRMATFHVIRAADKKSFREIQDAIRAAQKERVAEGPEAWKWKLFLRLSAPVPALLLLAARPSRELRKQLSGTVAITAIGMAGGAAAGGCRLPATR